MVPSVSTKHLDPEESDPTKTPLHCCLIMYNVFAFWKTGTGLAGAGGAPSNQVPVLGTYNIQKVFTNQLSK